MASLVSLQKSIHAWAVDKEWRGPRAETQRTTGDDMALIISEAVEALEAFRFAGYPTSYWETYTVEVSGIKFKDMQKAQLAVLWDIDLQEIGWEDEVDSMIAELNLAAKPEGVGPELADTIIRILDYSENHGLDMDFEVERKMAHNQQRPIRHGGSHL